MSMTKHACNLFFLLLVACNDGSATSERPTRDDSTSNDTNHHDPQDDDGDGYIAEAADGSDCDDTDPNIHPGVPEQADGVDQDCDGLVDEHTDVYDDDGDGWTEVEGDCDDGDGETWPGARDDIPCDGVDRDCDGYEPCEHPDSSFARMIGATGATAIGESVAGGGDLTGDGRPDVVAGVSPTLVFEVPLLGGRQSASDAVASIELPYEGSESGMAMVGDLTGDGLDELLVGSTFPGREGVAYLLCGPLNGDHIAEDIARATYLDGNTSSALGWSVAGGTDITGDGMVDLVLAAPYHRDETGVVYVVSANAEGEVWLPDISTQIYGDTPQIHAGYTLALGGDNNGDGVEDVLIGGMGRLAEGWPSKVAWFAGPVASGHVALSGADVLFDETDEEKIATPIVGRGDVDGDGRDDFAITTIHRCAAGVSLFTNPGVGALADAVARLDGGGSCSGDEGEPLGSDISLLDANGDGLQDVLVGAPYSQVGGGYSSQQGGALMTSGAAALFLAPFSGTRTVWEADGLWAGEQNDDFLGWSVSTAGDMDQDGIEDLLIGAAYFDDPDDDVTSTVGAAYVILGQPTW